MVLNTIIGVTGLVLLLIGFFLNELDKIDDNSISYNVLNFIGPLMLIWYAYTLNSIIFMVINIVWAMVSGIKLIKLSAKRR